MINYYFKLNDEQKKLSHFENNFSIKGMLDDLVFYKKDKFYVDNFLIL